MKKIICLCCAFFIFAQSTAISFAEGKPLDITAKAVVLMEASTGKILYEQNKDEKLPIASVTKIMTMLLIMESLDSGKIKIDEMVTVSERAKSMGGSTMFLETGEQLTVHDMLKGIAVASANDGCVAMGEHIAGSEAAFINMMNQRAKELGMKNTNFVNTNGLDDDNHYSTSYDVAIMSRELIKHEKIFEYTTIWTDSLRDGKFQLANTNKLVRFYKGANGLKTGSTSKAQCCVSGTAKRDNMQLISVVLGAPNSKERFANASKMLDYGFANYAITKEISKDEQIQNVPIPKGITNSVNAVAKNDFTYLVSKGDKTKLVRNVTIDTELFAPIQKGQKIGTLQFTKDGTVVGEVELISDSDVVKKGLSSWILSILFELING